MCEEASPIKLDTHIYIYIERERREVPIPRASIGRPIAGPALGRHLDGCDWCTFAPIWVRRWLCRSCFTTRSESFGPDCFFVFVSLPCSPHLLSVLALVRLHRIRGTMYLFSGAWVSLLVCDIYIYIYIYIYAPPTRKNGRLASYCLRNSEQCSAVLLDFCCGQRPHGGTHTQGRMGR